MRTADVSRLRSTRTEVGLPVRDLTPARLRLGVAALWALTSLILLVIARDHIAGLEMWDPDDYLRLQQVRDWLGGQGFLDVTQYRIDPPLGVPMHWSRLVDLPLAALILLLRPWLGQPLAEQVTAAVVPLITLGVSLSLLALLTRRLADRRTALLAAMLAATAPLMLFHLLPLRIDHHGWQTSFGLLTVAACFDPRPRRGGGIAGIAAAIWLAISLEALPMAAATGTMLAIRYVAQGDNSPAETRFRAFAIALALGGLALFVGQHDLAAYAQPWCDAVSPAWAGPMLVTPALAAASLPFARGRGMGARIGLLLIAGAAGIALLAATAPACLGGPFANLDPVVRRYWYENVSEGLPVWRQTPNNIAVLVGFPLIGIAGGLVAWRRKARTAAGRDWLALTALTIAAYAVSLLVQRSGAYGHALAVPGAAWLLARALERTQRWRHTLPRAFGSAAAILTLSPIGAMAAGGLLIAPFVSAEAADEAAATVKNCIAPCTSMAALAAMKPAYILTGIDLTPRLLITTPHSYSASGHHRGHDAMRRVILSFSGPPDVAHRIMAERGMDYVLIDPIGGEAKVYVKAAPDGLMARLLRDEAPGWLQPVPLPGSTLKMWKRIG